MSTCTTYVSEFEEDIDKDTEDDSSDPFFPRAGEDETEFAIRWCVRGVIDAFVARETARIVIDESCHHRRPSGLPSRKKTPKRRDRPFRWTREVKTNQPREQRKEREVLLTHGGVARERHLLTRSCRKRRNVLVSRSEHILYRSRAFRGSYRSRCQAHGNGQVAIPEVLRMLTW